MKCKVEGCEEKTAGQSKYCKVHRAESRKRFKEMVAQQAEEREERNKGFAELWQRANEAGHGAALAAKPQMVQAVDEASGSASESFPICGFAWISIHPGNCQFANWLKKNGHAHNGYRGGVEASVHDYNQSYDLKYAHATAAAKVLQEAGIKAYAGGRLD